MRIVFMVNRKRYVLLTPEHFTQTDIYKIKLEYRELAKQGIDNLTRVDSFGNKTIYKKVN